MSDIRNDALRGIWYKLLAFKKADRLGEGFGATEVIKWLDEAGWLARPVTEEMVERVAEAIDEVDGGASSVIPRGDATYWEMAEAAIAASREVAE